MVEGVKTINYMVSSYSIDFNGELPAPESVNESGLQGYSDSWPTNPYAYEPMSQGTGAGEFTYEIDSSAATYTLRGFGEGGKVLTEVTGPLQPE